ncbi:unnamed protein product [Fusarium graminearum]|uniref:Uncharacterized protein n=1 Tax=Gibberella zeae TaxID=5518 RepID=A0A4E9EEV4_GIBZA|nr:unnamed protein product [Fusarium graminearum]
MLPSSGIKPESSPPEGQPLPVANGNVTTTPTRAFVTEDIEKPRFKHTLSERWTRKKKKKFPKSRT